MEIRLEPGSFAGKEWMVANGFGGYASGTLGGGCSRRHDGLLVAALPAPCGRTVMLDGIEETVILPDGTRLALFDHGVEFRLDHGLPVWEFAVAGRRVIRRVVMPYRQNSTHVLYDIQGEAMALEIRPWLFPRHADWQLDQDQPDLPLTEVEGRVEIACHRFGTLRLKAGVPLHPDQRFLDNVYPIEAERGYLAQARLWSPGTFTLEGDSPSLLASTESWAVAEALVPHDALAAELERRARLLGRAHPALQGGMAATLCLAADAFVFQPSNRPELNARVEAAGDQLRSIVAGYPWFNDWGRDTMIALEGLTLVTGRPEVARSALLTFARYVKDGLIPCNIPDGDWPPVYHAADASLWFFHAVDRYLEATGDTETLARLAPALTEIIEAHLHGTLFGIGMDPVDGLLRQGADGFQLTWMDAIIGDWVVTPRRGKPVEINALWHNALCVAAKWLQRDDLALRAARARHSFNQRFWYEEGGYLYDVVDGDPAESPLCRPNQIYAVALPHPVLDPSRWQQVVEALRDRLLTPFGLRSLAPGSAGYKPRFGGDQLSRDGAYHQGTVWPFLLGGFVDAWLKVWPEDKEGARAVLAAMEPHLSDYCVGTIAEVFDADQPHQPHGCTAQAWSVAEWLRAWVKVWKSA